MMDGGEKEWAASKQAVYELGKLVEGRRKARGLDLS